MPEYSREELLEMLGKADEPQTRTVEVRGRAIAVDDAKMRSWPVVVQLSKLMDMDGLHATVGLMAIVTECTDLEEEDVLQLSGGHTADFGEVAKTLGEISELIFPKA